MDFQDGDTPQGVSLCGSVDSYLLEQLNRLEGGQQSMADSVARRQEIQIQLLETIVERLANLQVRPTTESTEFPWQTLYEAEAERDALQKQLAELPEQDDEPSEELETLERRLEMALDDLKEARAQIQQFEASSPAAASRELDWEAQKRFVLKQLDDSESSDSERVSIQQVIDATDEIVKRKDEEIVELQRLLQHQSENIGGFAVGAAAVEQLLETDELIVQERENLGRLQDEWREKLKRAEIEISMERARLARERKELEAQLETYEQEKSRMETLLAAQKADTSRCRNTSPRNRWFSRLGLSESSEEA